MKNKSRTVRKAAIVLLALCMMSGVFTAGASASTGYSYSSAEKQELETILSQFAWYDWSNSGYSAVNYGTANSIRTTGILSGVIRHPLAVDYSLYPVSSPQKISGKDPRGQWGSYTLYYKIPESSVNWVLKYAFSLTDEQIASLRARIDAGEDTCAYRSGGYYYTFYGGVGGGYKATLKSMSRDNGYYRATYRLEGGDGEWEDYGTRYAVFEKNRYDGKTYWSLLYDGKTEPAADLPFLDIPAGQYYVDPVKWAVENEITSGTGTYSFSPDRSCTRAQAVTFLWRAAGSPKVNKSSGFKDVPSGAYYEKAVSWAVEKGITTGTGNGCFSPDQSCTRAQIVTLLYRAAGSPAVSSVKTFGDVKAGAYYEKAVNWAVKKGITTGTSGNAFSPDQPCSRAQIVTFLYRMRDTEITGTDPEEISPWYGTYTNEFGESFTVTNVTDKNVYLTANMKSAEGSWYTIDRVLTFTDTSLKQASVPFRTGDTMLVYYNLKGDRITVDYPDGWWADQDFIRN